MADKVMVKIAASLFRFGRATQLNMQQKNICALQGYLQMIAKVLSGKVGKVSSGN